MRFDGSHLSSAKEHPGATAGHRSEGRAAALSGSGARGAPELRQPGRQPALHGSHDDDPPRTGRHHLRQPLLVDAADGEPRLRRRLRRPLARQVQTRAPPGPAWWVWSTRGRCRSSPRHRPARPRPPGPRVVRGCDRTSHVRPDDRASLRRRQVALPDVQDVRPRGHREVGAVVHREQRAVAPARRGERRQQLRAPRRPPGASRATARCRRRHPARRRGTARGRPARGGRRCTGRAWPRRGGAGERRAGWGWSPGWSPADPTRRYGQGRSTGAHTG